MSVYLLKQQTETGGVVRITAVMAGDRSNAKYKAESEYGGKWNIMNSHPTLEDVSDMVEDSPSETLLLNL